MNRYYMRSFYMMLLIMIACIFMYKLFMPNSRNLGSLPSKIKATKSGNKATIVKNTSVKKYRIQNKIQTRLYNYLMDFENRESVKEKAIQLNNGHQRNSCVYFASETLRRVGYSIPIAICYTGKLDSEYKRKFSLTCFLQKMGWKHSNNLSLLLPGDICFTTSDSYGAPTHTYIFMGWVKEGSEDFGYVCDNQSYDYKYTLHIRNIRSSLNDKDAFSYFFYLDN